MAKKVSTAQVKHIANLANIPITTREQQELAAAFSETLAVVDNLLKINIKNIEPTHQVNDLENVLREDKVDEERMFSQEEALANAARTHEGYFVVPRVIDEN